MWDLIAIGLVIFLGCAVKGMLDDIAEKEAYKKRRR